MQQRIILDTLGKLHAYRHGMFSYCIACGDRYDRADIQGSPRAAFSIDVTALIEERGPDSPVVGMACVPCPNCGSGRTEIRIASPSKHEPLPFEETADDPRD